MELTQEQHRAAFERQLRRGEGIHDLPIGPTLAQFNALELAQALEYAMQGQEPKVRIDMNKIDAQALASFLRRSVILGA